MADAKPFFTSADAYDRWVGRYGSSLSAELVAFAGVKPGMLALDVGCGPGALTTALVELLGPDNVAAVDPSEPFVEAARDRLPGVEIRVAPAEKLPFMDDRIDVVLSQLVVNFMSDAEAGVREMARVAKPGGTVAACVWDYAGEMTLVHTFWEAAHEVEPERTAAADEGANMKHCSEDELAELWRAAGLEDVRTTGLTARARYESFEELWEPLPTGIAPAGAFTKALDADGQKALHDAYERLLDVGDGPFELTARAWAVAGTA